MHRRLFITSFLALTSVGSAIAAPATALLSAEDLARVDAVNAYLTGLKSVHGRFTQSDPQGGQSAGSIWLKRPGKARFQYDPPADLLVVSDGYNVMINDRKLKTFDQYPLGATPLGLLLARQVRLDKGVVITAVTDTAHGFSITARDGRKAADGAIALQFTEAPLALTGWTVVDGQGQRTQVTLGVLEQAPDLDANLFILRDPRPRRGHE